MVSALWIIYLFVVVLRALSLVLIASRISVVVVVFVVGFFKQTLRMTDDASTRRLILWRPLSPVDAWRTLTPTYPSTGWLTGGPPGSRVPLNFKVLCVLDRKSVV